MRFLTARRLLLAFPFLLGGVLVAGGYAFQKMTEEHGTWMERVLSDDLPHMVSVIDATKAIFAHEQDFYLYVLQAPEMDGVDQYVLGQALLDGFDEKWVELDSAIYDLETVSHVPDPHIPNAANAHLHDRVTAQFKIFRATVVAALRHASGDPALLAAHSRKVFLEARELSGVIDELRDFAHAKLASEMRTHWSILRAEGRKTLYQASIAALCLFALMVLFIHLINKNILRVRDRLEQLAVGQTEAVLKDDEIDPDFHPIISVSHKLEESHRALRNLNRELRQEKELLDQRVGERTRALEEINAGLSDEIDRRLKVEETLRLFQTVIEHTDEAVVITDSENDIISVNEAFTRTTGYTPDDVLGKNPRVMQSAKQSPEFYRRMWRSIETQGAWSGEIWDKRKSGEIYPKWLTINVIRDAEGQPQNYIGIFQDITEQKDTQLKLEELAFRDSLTGVANRAMFMDKLGRDIAVAERQGWTLALMFIDLDRFKQVNDALGHEAGDELLKIVAERILKSVRKSDTVARVGGDEFAVILPAIHSEAIVARLAGEIIRHLEDGFDIAGNRAHIGGSIGIALYPRDGEDVESLIKHADMAMYNAKKDGKGTYRFYSEALNRENRRKFTLDAEMREALIHQQFEVWYQPKICLQSARITAAEALVRWRHPDHGILPPGAFIEIAEETGMIIPLGAWVLNRVCADIRAWRRELDIECPVSVNLSPMQFRDRNLVPEVKNALYRSDLSPKMLEFEITEGMAFLDQEEAKLKLKELSNLGIRFAIDDFGTAYSSFAQLKQMPVNTLKIDRSFVSGIGITKSDEAIIECTFLLAKAMALNTVVEGVETAKELDFVIKRDKGSLVQGYLFSPPVPNSEFRELLIGGGNAAKWFELLGGRGVPLSKVYPPKRQPVPGV